MKQLLLGSMALAALLASPAMAADMRVKAPAPPPPVVLYDWSGVYVGVNIGHMWYDVDRHFPGGEIFCGKEEFGLFCNERSGGFSTSDSDHIFGGHVGAQWQWGQIVFGVEAALTGCFQECRSLSGVLPSPPFTPDTSAEHKITNLFTIGPRLGWAWDRVMIFATGGFAAASLKGTYCDTVTGICGPFVTSQNGNTTWNHGWYAGGGFDYMIHKGPLVDAIVGFEAQYWEVDSKAAYCFAPDCSFASRVDYDLGAEGFLVRARFTIKTQGWGWWGAPPPAPAPAAVRARS